jgi:uncharacterized protein (DUF2336 family)
MTALEKIEAGRDAFGKMTTTRAALTHADIRLLIKGAEPEERALVAHRLCRRIDREGLTDSERAEAHAILRALAADAAEQVRLALAVTLRSSPLVPRDVAKRLARDTDRIALPLLNFSPAFTDEDLVEIVRVSGAARQCAIARRPTVSEQVTAEIAIHGAARAVQAACENPGARFSEHGLNTVVDRFEASGPVMTAMAVREALPASIAERLVGLVSEELRERMVARHAVSPQVAIAIAAGARERASLDLVEQAARASDLPSFIAHLQRGGRLTPSLMLRALVNGQMSFFEWAVAELAGVPQHRAWLMIHDAGELGLKAIYERAGLPSRLLPAFRAAVDTYHSLEFDGGPDDRPRFRRRMLERFLTQNPAASRDDVDYLLDKIDQLAVEAAPAMVERASAA